MADGIEDIGRVLGAKIVRPVPDVGGGMLGAAHLAPIYQARMREIRGQDPGEPTTTLGGRTLEVPISETVVQALGELAGLVNRRTGRAVTPAELASGLLSGAALHWAEYLRQLRDRTAEAPEKRAKATDDAAEAERALQAALREMCEVPGR